MKQKIVTKTGGNSAWPVVSTTLSIAIPLRPIHKGITNEALSVCIGALMALSGLACAQTGYSITGYMSNFDCSNHCDSPCDEMEIDIEGVHPEDVIHTYHNGNYGAPSVTLSDDGSYTIVDYRHPAHLTSVNAIEHFGVTLRGAIYGGPVDHPVRIRWFRDGSPNTVNGHVPNPVTGGSAPATQPLQPSIAAAVTPGQHGTGGVSLTVTNNDPAQGIWVMRRANVSAAPVTLEALMPNDPVVTGTVIIDASPVFVAPLTSLNLARDFIDIEEDQNAIFTARYFQNLASIGPFTEHVPGPELGNIMTATQAAVQRPCEHSMPTIVSQPTSVTQDAGTRVDLRVTGRGDDISPLEYQWMRDGVNLTDGSGVSGTTSNHLRVNSLSAASEGFYSVRITNQCATIISDSALVFITGHNNAPVHRIECPTFTTQPQADTGCQSDAFTFAVAAAGSDPMAYHWSLVGGAPLYDGNFFDIQTGMRFQVSGSTTNVLRVRNFTLGAHASQMSFVATAANTCGTVTSLPANLSLCSCLACPADFNQDGGVDGTDVDTFFAQWEGGNCDADVNADGGVDGLDVQVFFGAWENGGC